MPHIVMMMAGHTKTSGEINYIDRQTDRQTNKIEG